MNVTCPDCRSIFRIDPGKVPAGGVRARCSICGGVFAVAAVSPHSHAPAVSTAANEEVPRVLSAAAPVIPSAASAEATAAAARPEGVARAPDSALVDPAPGAPAPTESTAAQPSPKQVVPAPPAPAVADAPSIWGSPASVPAARFDAAPASHAPPMPERPSGPTPAASARVTAAATVAPSPTPSPTPSTASAAPASSGPATPPPAAPAAAAPGEGAPRRPVNPYLSNDPGQKARRLARALVSDLIAYHPQKREEGLRAGTLKQLFRDEIRKSWEEYVEQVGAQVAESTPHFQDALNDLLAGGRKVF